MLRTLGTCCYPEHWPRDIWEQDAERMSAAGLTWVRIGEFSWSKLEPNPGELDFEWLDDAIEVLGNAGLKVVLGTPTATPPRWMVDRHPDMFAYDQNGRPRKFGSRRHYCFSHEGYKGECARIVRLLAERYGQNPYVAAWQTDNEYGCHDTTLSYSPAAKSAFKMWLRNRYPGQGNDGDISALNAAWGNAFWSMDYNNFEQIDLPNLTVTEPNPAHLLDFRRFTSDQVVAFNKLQANIIREHSEAPVAHNYMGRITDFDHFKVGDDLEIASWDSYPLGFLEDRVEADDDHKRKYARQGDPDFQAFHHDLYRTVGRGRWWVMEQQPGPVNWAPYNPAPFVGMVRFWTWEAFAHGAEAVCYFRWRQAPFAQEQMHAGLLRPDSIDAPGIAEARQVADELKTSDGIEPYKSKVAILFDYEADWSWDIQPHGANASYFDLVFDTYKAMRKLGQSIDIIPGTSTDFDQYSLVAAPGLMALGAPTKMALEQFGGCVVLGPRTAARGATFDIPTPLPPSISGLNTRISRVESIRPDMPIGLASGGNIIKYREIIETSDHVFETSHTGEPVMVGNGKMTYLAAWLDQEALVRVLKAQLENAGVKTMAMKDGVRRRETGNETFLFNHTTTDQIVDGTVLPGLSVRRTLKTI